MNSETSETYEFSLSKVIFQAMSGLNLVELYLKEARQQEDRNAVRWLEDTRRSYLQILGSAQEFARDRSAPPVM